jgi:cytidine deaminase
VIYNIIATFVELKKIMEAKSLNISIKILKTEELSEGDSLLRDEAIKAATNAYAPYSNFFVGAAVRLKSGDIVTGCNQENVAFPSGLCAERVALFYANSQFPHIPVESLAIAAIKNGIVEEIISPCGACRQVILETENRFDQDIRILLCGKDETLIVSSAKDLLPLSFSKITN